MFNLKKIHKRNNKKGGFTLIEILVVIGILAILATIVLVAVNPNRQFKLARDSQRTANVASILNAIGQNIADHNGLFNCNGLPANIPTDSTIIGSTQFDLAQCVVPTYISALPFDPSRDGSYYNNEDDYNTGYNVIMDGNGRITVSALAEISTTTISATR